MRQPRSTALSLACALALTGCGGSSPSSAPRAAASAPVTSAASPPAGSAGSVTSASSGTTTGLTGSAPAAPLALANGAATGFTPAQLEDTVQTRLVIQGSGFTSPAYVELSGGLLLVAVEAVEVRPDEIQALIPALGAGRYDLRVGQGSMASYVPGALELSGAAALPLDVVRTPVTAGPGVRDQLLYPRADHRALGLTSGAALIVGGGDAQGRALAPVELYDPAYGLSGTLAHLREPRVRHQAVLLDSGKVLVAGGVRAPANGPLGWGPADGLPFEVIDAVGGLHDAIGPGLVREEFALAPLPGDRALVVGGVGVAAGSEALIVDVAARTVTAIAAPATHRRDAAAIALASGEVLVIGGTDVATGLALDTIDRFDPATATWSALAAQLSVPRSGARALAPGGFLADFVVVGGQVGPASFEAFSNGAFGLTPTAIPEPGPFEAAATRDCVAVLGPRLAAERLMLCDEAGRSVFFQPAVPLDMASGAALAPVGAGELALIGGRAGGQVVSTITRLDPAGALASAFGTASPSPPPPVIHGQPLPGAPSAVPHDAVVYGMVVPVDDAVAYVLDLSGSMAWGQSTFVDLSGQTRTGTRFEAATHELARSITNLDPGVRFNVHLFDCSVRSWRADAAYADASAKQSALAFLFAAQPTGATGTGPAVAHALSDRSVGSVILVTDGAPNCGATDPAGHRSMIHQANAQGASIFTFGIGATGVFQQFLMDVAYQSGGGYTPVP